MYGPCSIRLRLPHPAPSKKARDFFDAKHRNAIWDANPDWKRREVLDEIRKRWANLSNTEGIEYHKLALGEKERYARQEAAHEASELNEDELKGILVGHLPPVIVFFNGNQFAESEWGRGANRRSHGHRRERGGAFAGGHPTRAPRRPREAASRRRRGS